MSQTADIVQLKEATLHAFDDYIAQAESEMQATLHESGSFLWSQDTPKRSQQVRGGAILAQFWRGARPAKVPDGLIHDWVGAALSPGVTVEETLALVQDYDHHKVIYAPDVMDSRLIRHQGDDFSIFLRLLKKKIITVVLDTDHEVHYSKIDDTRWACRSYTTRIAEVEDAGTKRERVLPPDTGYGFLWRLFSYWRFGEESKGVTIECRAISLTRDVPFGLGWVIEPIIKSLPRESLINTLKATREALATR
jgi:hypothetical protein